MSVVNWERGYRFPMRRKLAALVKALDIPESEITSRR
jgi:transcriptional regulator with XRE-family HTH domain